MESKRLPVQFGLTAKQAFLAPSVCVCVCLCVCMFEKCVCLFSVILFECVGEHAKKDIYFGVCIYS